MVKPKKSYQETHAESAQGSDMLNRLRAGVLGANDGIVSTAGVIMGVVGATSDMQQILVAAVAAVVAGALSMAAGEYVSVSSQSDAEKAFVRREEKLLEDYPDEELDELTSYYVAQGISPETARQAAIEVTGKNALKAHVKMETGMELDEYVNPWSAAASSLVAFTIGSLVPVLAVIIAPPGAKPVAVVAAVLVALVGTGCISAHVGRAPKLRAVARVAIGGLLAMLIAYGVGSLFDVNV